jgi:hypothetical protein
MGRDRQFGSRKWALVLGRWCVRWCAVLMLAGRDEWRVCVLCVCRICVLRAGSSTGAGVGGWRASWPFRLWQSSGSWEARAARSVWPQSAVVGPSLSVGVGGVPELLLVPGWWYMYMCVGRALLVRTTTTT